MVGLEEEIHNGFRTGIHRVDLGDVQDRFREEYIMVDLYGKYTSGFGAE